MGMQGLTVLGLLGLSLLTTVGYGGWPESTTLTAVPPVGLGLVSPTGADPSATVRPLIPAPVGSAEPPPTGGTIRIPPPHLPLRDAASGPNGHSRVGAITRGLLLL